jgi:polysaccharide export outer membrane protein
LTDPNQRAAQCQTVENDGLDRIHSMSPPKSLLERRTLRFLCALGVSAVSLSGARIHRRDAEHAEVTQRKNCFSDRLLRMPVERSSLRIDAMSLFSVMLLIIPLASGTQVSAQGSQPASQSTSQTGDRYRIGPGDVLDIRIFKHTELSRDNVRVDGSGLIRMPLVDEEIQAACKTESEIAKDIATHYLKYYRNPQVDVFVKEYHSREVAVIGSITEQGRYQMQRRIRLLELLSFAKGPSEKAGQTVNIVRAPRSGLCNSTPGSGEEGGSFISLRLNDTLRGEEKANPYVEPGDIVTLPEADQVYVVGNVYHPQALPMKDPISVSRAVAMAGGPLRDSKTDRVRIVRRQPGSSTASEIFVDLTAIRRMKAEDIALQPNDIVEVTESSGKTMIRSLLGVIAPSLGQLPVRVIP